VARALVLVLSTSKLEEVIWLIPMEDFILLFLRMSCHLKYFECVNEITLKIHDFILEFYNTKLYFVSLFVFEMK
jgi:hypothetical protein